MVMIAKKILISLIMTITATSAFVIIENTISSVSACETNAIGCQKEGGPGASVASPPEVSGCSYFPPVGPCAQSSTPPQMGLGQH
jgi:hypothetical protein